MSMQPTSQTAALDTRRRSVPAVMLVIGVWLVWGAVFTTFFYFENFPENQRPSYLVELTASLMYWLSWIPVTFLISYLLRRYPFDKERILPTVLLHFGLSLVLLVAQLSLAAVLTAVSVSVREGKLVPYWWFADHWLNFLISWRLLVGYIVYCTVLGVIQALNYRRQYVERAEQAKRLEHELTAQRLESLRAQLQPHFLFNALHTIVALMDEGRFTESQRMAVNLGELLRKSLDDTSRHLIPLEEELQLVQTYLAIEQIRFCDRLEVMIDVPDSLRPAQVPNMILQPLVENAIKHGLAHCVDGGRIDIAASNLNGQLRLQVINSLSPTGTTEPAQPGLGRGLAITQQRLQSLFPENSHMVLEPLQDNRMAATIVIPLIIPTVVTVQAQ